MKCDICGKNEATTHIRSVINGNVSEANLCSYCAARQNISFGRVGMMDMLMSAFDPLQLSKTDEETKVCRNCGASFNDIISFGMVGCPECYKTFYNKLMPTIKKAHGRTTHIGKIPVSSAPRLNSQTRIETLKKRMAQAVESENFELAATLRDTIKQLEDNKNE